MGKTLAGTNLAGMSTTRDRVEDDYYATPYEATKMLLDTIKFDGNFLEPCIGGGHIAEIIKEYYNSEVFGSDLIDRGYPNTYVADFLTHNFDRKFDNIITNPPYSLAQEFLEKGMEVINNKGKIAMFLKIQFLEGVKRREMFKRYPPKYVYVFSKRQNPWRNGSQVNEKGKPWASTMCFAWFIWEQGSKSEPIIKWL